ncbi:MAG: hypothetical protein D6746_16235 [Bacteroidetes bacterium]|nr:MAG: hypothetical protein D6746_16235 [Bacteroidota bacterium]
METPIPFEAVRRTEAADVTIRYGNETLAVRTYNWTRGLFRMNDGRLVHFTFCKLGDERVFGVEVFDASGTLLGYGPIRGVPWRPDGPSVLRWDVVWKDARDRFYLIDLEHIPMIRVVELAYGPKP